MMLYCIAKTRNAKGSGGGLIDEGEVAGQGEAGEIFDTFVFKADGTFRKDAEAMGKYVDGDEFVTLHKGRWSLTTM